MLVITTTKVSWVLMDSSKETLRRILVLEERRSLHFPSGPLSLGDWPLFSAHFLLLGCAVEGEGDK
jgi:hypothetical protein